MDRLLRKPDVAGDLAPRAAARRRIVRGLGLFAEIRARRRRPRSAADRGDPARRARRSRHRRAGRRSRLCRPARLDRADIGRAARRARCWIPSSRCIRRCRNSRGCIATSKPPSSMRWRRRIATARISTARTCSKAALPGPGRVQSGWLNRALEALPRGERVTSALAVGPTTPLVLRGAAPTVGWAPVALPQADDDTAMRLVELYRHRDPALASALSQGLQLDKVRARRRHEAEARHQRCRRDAAGGARRGQADGRRRRPADRGARVRRLGHPRQ